MSDPYFLRHEVSNSDLSEMWRIVCPPKIQIDLKTAYRLGTLFDIMVTEPKKANHYLKKIESEQYTDDEWNNAVKMLNSFRGDPMCMALLGACEGQRIFSRDMDFDCYGVKFTLPTRVKYDLFEKINHYGVDLKSTAATTYKTFIAACKNFDYHRAAAWYMDVSQSDQFCIIGVSKKNYKIFKLFIKRGDDLYLEGKDRYDTLAYRYYTTIDAINESN